MEKLSPLAEMDKLIGTLQAKLIASSTDEVAKIADALRFALLDRHRLETGTASGYGPHCGIDE